MESQEWVSLWRIQVQDYIAAATKRQAQRSIMPHGRQRQAMCRTQGHLCGMGHSNTRCASPAQCDGLPAGTHTCLCTLELSQDPHRAESVGKLVYWTERHFSILPAWPQCSGLLQTKARTWERQGLMYSIHSSRTDHSLTSLSVLSGFVYAAFPRFNRGRSSNLCPD